MDTLSNKILFGWKQLLSLQYEKKGSKVQYTVDT